MARPWSNEPKGELPRGPLQGERPDIPDSPRQWGPCDLRAATALQEKRLRRHEARDSDPYSRRFGHFRALGGKDRPLAWWIEAFCSFAAGPVARTPCTSSPLGCHPRQFVLLHPFQVRFISPSGFPCRRRVPEKAHLSTPLACRSTFVILDRVELRPLTDRFRVLDSLKKLTFDEPE